MHNYLNVNKSVIISSPAGSGKTEKLARRYIALLKSGVDVERILAITFTDKAAAEMKQRILRILSDEDSSLFKKLLEKMSLMRVSTIHSFCGTLLRRFSFEASIDPNYRIEDAIDSSIAWEEVLYEILMEAGGGEDGRELLLRALSEKGFGGLEYLKTTINYLFEKVPFSLEADIVKTTQMQDVIGELKNWPGAREAIENYEELFEKDFFEGLLHAGKYFLTDKKEPRKKIPTPLGSIVDYKGWALKMWQYWKNKNLQEHTDSAVRIKEIFRRCFNNYHDKKGLKGILDFSDLEYLTYRLLTENPEWANILYAFDEKTDHVLVDEFQDTNSFQWAIIDKLTEEWRSGMGAKRGEGIMPTIFLVGDEKQSIYFFRGANVEIFQMAKEKLSDWLKEGFYYEEVKENFRSRPAIINFTNHVFSKIMRAVGIDLYRDENVPSWITRYNPFEACRTDTQQDAGRVELILLDEDIETVVAAKQREADVIAKRIQSLVGDFQITDRTSSQHRSCKYMDIAVLLRKRTHLKRYEEAFRQHRIPFVVVKGVGFYQEPEVAMLRALIYFLSNPKDDYSLYILLKSPFFSIDEGTIIKTINREGDCLFSKLRTLSNGSSRHFGINGLNSSLKLLEEWLSLLPHTPVSELIEKALAQTKAWMYFHESQRRANIKKFIRLMEDLETNGKSLFKIKNFLERTSSKGEEPKANVNTEGMDAVKIMTIHASKGLEFPIVFIPGIEETVTLRTKDSLIYETDGKLFFKYEPESIIRRQDEDFQLYLRKEEEEQKRLFYVAVTRAEEALFLISRWSESDFGTSRNFLSFLKQGLSLEKKGTGYKIAPGIQGVSLLTEHEVEVLYEKTPRLEQKIVPRAVEVIPLTAESRPHWKAVTEVVDIRRQHGKDWVILGDVIHRLFEGISKRIVSGEDIKIHAEKLLMLKGVVKEQKERFLSIIEKDVSLLKEKRIWQNVIMPKKNSFSELPFILESEKVDATRSRAVYAGRIDRVIKEDGIYKIYDYKSFPVDEEEIEYLLKGYSFQLGIYREAVKKLFKPKDVKSFIVFTHIGEIKKI